MSEGMFNEFVEDVFIQGESLDLKTNSSNEDVKYVMDEFSEDVEEDVKYVMDEIDEDIKMDVKYVMDEFNSSETDKKVVDFVKSINSDEDKLSFVRLKNKYLIIKNIDNYQELEKTLYKNKSKIEIIKFEISRIVKHMNNNEKVSEQIANVEKILHMHRDLSEELYTQIINLIIKVELLLDMKIGLFNELCLMFENEMVI